MFFYYHSYLIDANKIYNTSKNQHTRILGVGVDFTYISQMVSLSQQFISFYIFDFFRLGVKHKIFSQKESITFFFFFNKIYCEQDMWPTRYRKIQKDAESIVVGLIISTIFKETNSCIERLLFRTIVAEVKELWAIMEKV